MAFKGTQAVGSKDWGREEGMLAALDEGESSERACLPANMRAWYACGEPLLAVHVASLCVAVTLQHVVMQSPGEVVCACLVAAAALSK